MKYSINSWDSCPKCDLQIEGTPTEDKNGNELDLLDRNYIPSHYCLGLKETEGFFIKGDKK